MSNQQLRYSAGEVWSYKFSFRMENGWTTDNSKIADIIWQFKRFDSMTSSGPDITVQVKDNNIVLRYPNKQITLIKNYSPSLVGKWIDFKFEIFWSSGADGKIKVWTKTQDLSDYTLAVDVTGQTALNDERSAGYLKWGLYKPDINKSTEQIQTQGRIAYHDEIYAQKLKNFRFLQSSLQGVMNKALHLDSVITGIKVQSCNVYPQLPQGLILNSDCSVFGTPTVSQQKTKHNILVNYIFQSSREPSGFLSGTTSAEVEVEILGPPQIISVGSLMFPLSKTITSSNLSNVGGASESCRVTAGRLPKGLTLDRNCRLSGAVDVFSKPSTIEVTAENSAGKSKWNGPITVIEPPAFTYPILNNDIPINTLARFIAKHTSRSAIDKCEFVGPDGEVIATPLGFALNVKSCTLSVYKKNTLKKEYFIKASNLAGYKMVKITL